MKEKSFALPLAWLLVVLFSMFPTELRAQSRDDEVVIERCSDVYEFKLRKGNVVVSNKITTQYSALREYNIRIQPAVFYGDNIKFEGSSCSKGGEVEHRSVTPDNIFYDDSRACFYNVTLNRKNRKCEASFERTFTDVRYLTRVPLADEYFIRSKTVKFVIPDDVGDVILIPRNISGGIVANEERNGNKRVVTYTIANLPAMKSEENMPLSSSVYPIVLIGGAFRNVAELYKWSHDLSQVDTRLPQLREILQAIDGSGLDDIEKMRRTYAWVQGNIRYVAFEAGISGHRPDTPAEVVRKRYGDCKGMALLLKTLLQAQGIDARLTYLGTAQVPSHISELAALCSMNHVICTANVDDKTYYLDATNHYIPATHIPGNIQGMEALIEDGDGYKMVNLPVLPPGASCDSVRVTLSLTQGNVLEGGIERWARGDMKEMLLTGLNGGDARNRASKIANMLNDEAHSFTIENARLASGEQSGEWVTVTGGIRDAHSVTSVDDELYIELDPDIFFITNPVDTAKRIHDYMFPYPFRQANEVVLSVPAGYKVENLPGDFHSETATGTMDCSFRQEGGKVIFTKTMTITDRRLKRDEINEWNRRLKAWSQACHEQITLKTP